MHPLRSSYRYIPLLYGRPSIQQSQSVQLLGVLCFVIPRPKFILVQVRVVATLSTMLLHTLTTLKNPPSIPTLMLCALVQLLRGSRLIIDWHNYGERVLPSEQASPTQSSRVFYSCHVAREELGHCPSRTMVGGLASSYLAHDLTVATGSRRHSADWHMRISASRTLSRRIWLLAGGSGVYIPS